MSLMLDNLWYLYKVIVSYHDEEAASDHPISAQTALAPEIGFLDHGRSWISSRKRSTGDVDQHKRETMRLVSGHNRISE